MHLVIYTNILTPYRKYFFDLVYRECEKNGDEFLVLVMAETEPGRSWVYCNLKAKYTILLNSRTITIGDANFHFNNNLCEILEKLKPTVLVCAGGYNCPGVWKAAKLKKRLNYKCFFWSETHLKEAKKSGKLKKVIREMVRRMTYRQFDGFWYAGTLSRQLCEKYALADAKYYFIPNLVEEDKFAQKPSHSQRIANKAKLGIKADKIVFLCPARLTSVKGILEFLEVIANSPEKSKAVFLIAGNGELRGEIETQAMRNQIDLRLLGEKKQEDLINLYAAADVFLLPSLSDPNPLSCIEALWSSLPLFISEHCGNYPEVVRQGKNGYVFSYQMPEKVVDMFDQIVKSDESWRISAGELSYEIAERAYSSQVAISRILDEMREI